MISFQPGSEGFQKLGCNH